MGFVVTTPILFTPGKTTFAMIPDAKDRLFAMGYTDVVVDSGSAGAIRKPEERVVTWWLNRLGTTPEEAKQDVVDSLNRVGFAAKIERAAAKIVEDATATAKSAAKEAVRTKDQLVDAANNAVNKGAEVGKAGAAGFGAGIGISAMLLLAVGLVAVVIFAKGASKAA